jgi:hypothetical protein
MWKLVINTGHSVVKRQVEAALSWSRTGEQIHIEFWCDKLLDYGHLKTDRRDMYENGLPQDHVLSEALVLAVFNLLAPKFF